MRFLLSGCPISPVEEEKTGEIAKKKKKYRGRSTRKRENEERKQPRKPIKEERERACSQNHGRVVLLFSHAWDLCIGLGSSRITRVML